MTLAVPLSEKKGCTNCQQRFATRNGLCAACTAGQTTDLVLHPGKACRACRVRYAQERGLCRGCARRLGDTRGNFERERDRQQRVEARAAIVARVDAPPRPERIVIADGVTYEVVWP